MSVIVDEQVANFESPATGGQTVKLADLRGKKVVLYFYPKDSTPGCTLEGQDFRDNLNKFKTLGVVIFGVSRDTLESHEKFKEKQRFNFELLADTDETLCTLFAVIKEKNMYGKKVMGIERSTFLIDAKGILRQEWRKVKVDGHVADVLQAAKDC